MKQSLSLLIPAYNEEKLLESSVDYYYQYLKKLKQIESFEIIICVNGSTDNTERIAKRLSQKHKEVTYLVTKNKGIGGALTLGMKAATKNIITYMPGDGEIEANFIEHALVLMDHCDFVSGSRKMAGAYEGKDFLRKMLSHGFNLVLTLLLSKQAAEAASVKMFRKEWAKRVAPHFENEGFEWQVEILYFALCDRLKICFAPSKTLKKRELTESSVQPFKTAYRLLKVCLNYGLKYRLKQLFQT